MSPHSVNRNALTAFLSLRVLTVLVLLAPLTAGLAPAADVHDAGTIPTGAGFSLSLVQPAVALYPTAARLEASGLPAFARHARRDPAVIVGPYAAIDEAEAVQRRLAGSGLRARLLVDESVRRARGFDAVPARGAAANVLLVAGGGRLSLVVELREEPRHVFTHRAGQVLEVNVGPIIGVVEPRRWQAPEGVDLLQRVSMDRIDRTIRTRVELSDLARTNVRVLGHRLYIDVWSAESELVGRPFPEVAGRPFTGGQRGTGAAGREGPPDKRTEAPPYEDQIAPAIARFQSMEPFVLSSVASPSPEVLAALERSLRELEGWIQDIQAPDESAPAHASLLSAVQIAIEAVQPSFGGDRIARVKEAFARVTAFEAATSYRLPATS